MHEGRRDQVPRAPGDTGDTPQASRHRPLPPAPQVQTGQTQAQPLGDHQGGDQEPEEHSAQGEE